MEASAGRITLNVGGVRYQAGRGVLSAFPGTKLGGLAEPQAASGLEFDGAAGEFFFDRSGRLFELVLHFCRSGHLPGPAGVCRAALQEELDFWGLSEARLPACCWSQLGPAEAGELGGPVEADERQGLLEPPGPPRAEGRWARWKRRAWALLDEPRSSRAAAVLTAILLLFNVAVVIILCVKGSQHDTSSGDGNVSHPHFYHHVSVESACPQTPSLLHLELFFVLCFMCEFAVRLASCPDKRTFLRQPLNAVDFLALFPVCIDLFFSGPARKPDALPCWLNVFRVVYILKLLKVFKLVETPLMLRVFPYMFKSILKDIAILVWVFTFEILFFGTLLHYAELSEKSPFSDSSFSNIFSCFWWAVITLTTIGYGDLVPFGTFSQFIGSCAALCGVLTIITPVPIFLIKFKDYYNSAVMKKRTKEEKPVPTRTT